MSKVYERMDSQSYSRVEQTLDHHNWEKYHAPTAVALCETQPDPGAELMTKLEDTESEYSDDEDDDDE